MKYLIMLLIFIFCLPVKAYKEHRPSPKINKISKEYVFKTFYHIEDSEWWEKDKNKPMEYVMYYDDVVDFSLRVSRDGVPNLIYYSGVESELTIIIRENKPIIYLNTYSSDPSLDICIFNDKECIPGAMEKALEETKEYFEDRMFSLYEELNIISGFYSYFKSKDDELKGAIKRVKKKKDK